MINSQSPVASEGFSDDIVSRIMADSEHHPGTEPDDGAIREKAGRAVRSVVAGKLAHQILTIGFTLVLARVLSPADYGLYGIAFLVLQLLIYLEGFRIESALIQRRALTLGEARQGYTILLVAGVLFSVLMVVLAVPVASLFDESGAVSLIRMLGIAFVIRALASIHRVHLRRELRFGTLALIEVSGLVPGGIAAVWMASSGYGAESLVAFYLIQSTIASIAAILVVRRYAPAIPRQALTRDLFTFGLPATGSEVVSYLWFHAPSIFVGWGIGTEALGFFRQALALVSKPVLYLQEVTSQLAFPVLSRAHEQGYEVKGAYLHAFHTVCLVGIPVCTFTLLFAPEIVHILYGSQWGAIIPLVRILVVVAFAKVLHPFASGLFQARGRPSTDLKINAAVLVVLVGLLASGLQFGATGIAAGTAVAFGVLGIVAQYIANKWLDVSLLEIVSTMLTGFGVSLVAGGIAFSTRLLVLPPDAMVRGLLLGLIAGGVVYVGVLYLVDRRSLRELTAVVLPMKRGVQ